MYDITIEHNLKFKYIYDITYEITYYHDILNKTTSIIFVKSGFDVESFTYGWN